MDALGKPDRAVRREIETLRRKGHWIVSIPTGGYYITDSPKVWNDFVDREKKRAVATFEKATILEDGQIEMEEV